MATKAFNHFGLTVSDLQASTDFYKLLGFEETPVSRLELVDLPWLPRIVALPGVSMIASPTATTTPRPSANPSP